MLFVFLRDASEVDLVDEAGGTRRNHYVRQEVRPGLTAAIGTLTPAGETSAETEMQPCLLFGVQLHGPRRTVSVNGEFAQIVEPFRPYVFAFNQATSFACRYQQGVQYCGVCLEVDRQFLTTMAEVGEGSEFDAVLALMEQGYFAEELAQNPLITAAAAALARNDHSEALASILMESCALAIVVDVAASVSAARYPTPTRLSGKDTNRVQELSQFLSENAAHPPSLSEMSRMVGLNPTTLSLHFKAVHGISIFTFVRRHRLETARVMLKSTDLPVAAVGYHVGFINAAAFSTAYRKEFGISPRADR